MAALDDFDLKILAILQTDGRISMVDLGNRVGLTETPCARRVKRLEAEGIITRYVALLDSEKIGVGVKALVQVRLRRQTQEAVAEFEAAVRKLSEVTECDLIAGDFDYVLYVRLKDLTALKDFIRDKVITIHSVGETRSMITLEPIKSTTSVPLPPLRRSR
jgi:Lrp/AsnC family transcriptional regulator, leucine-responsive regulatory protein